MSTSSREKEASRLHNPTFELAARDLSLFAQLLVEDRSLTPGAREGVPQAAPGSEERRWRGRKSHPGLEVTEPGAREVVVGWEGIFPAALTSPWSKAQVPLNRQVF